MITTLSDGERISDADIECVVPNLCARGLILSMIWDTNKEIWHLGLNPEQKSELTNLENRNIVVYGTESTRDYDMAYLTEGGAKVAHELQYLDYQIQKLSHGYYDIVSFHTKKCMDVLNFVEFGVVRFGEITLNMIPRLESNHEGITSVFVRLAEWGLLETARECLFVTEEGSDLISEWNDISYDLKKLELSKEGQ